MHPPSPIALILCAVAIPLLAFMSLRLLVSHRKRKQLAKSSIPGNPTTIAFFHIFNNDGGGAERVLWSAIQAIYSVPDWNVRCVIYSGETVEPSVILANVEKQFGIKLDREVEFVFIRSREMLQCLRFHRWSLWGLMFGAFIVAIECILKLQPDIMIDTTGHAAAVYAFKHFCQCQVVSYLHWPTITADDAEAIRKALVSSNGNEMSFLCMVKAVAQQLMLKVYLPLYSWLGRHADVIMVNSSWTGNHFAALWGIDIKPAEPVTMELNGHNANGVSASVKAQAELPKPASVNGFAGHASRLLNERINIQHTNGYHPNARSHGIPSSIANPTSSSTTTTPPSKRSSVASVNGSRGGEVNGDAGVNGRKKACGLIVYPPCNSAHRELSLDSKQRKFVAVAQFRPEKNHPLKLKALSILLQRHPHLKHEVMLSLVGTSRHHEDWVRVERLKAMAEELGLMDNVEFHVNSTFENLQAQLTASIAGLHTMWNEHFGIGVVEYMGGGVVPIANNTGGPRDDIVRPIDGKPTGYLAISPEEYADAMYNVLNLPAEELRAMQLRARKQADKFSDEAFARRFLDAITPIVESC